MRSSDTQKGYLTLFALQIPWGMPKTSSQACEPMPVLEPGRASKGEGGGDAPAKDCNRGTAEVTADFMM